MYLLAVTARASGQAVIPVHIFPFPLTEAELAKHAGSPHQAFWRGLMPGYAYFEKHHEPAELGAAGRRSSRRPLSSRGYLAAVPRFLLLFLALIALFNLSRVLREPRPDADRPMDFRTCYVGQAVLRQGQNPYDDATLKAGWQRMVRQEHLPSRTQPGLPNLPFLYPPWAAALFGLTIGRLPYAVAWPLWYGLALLSLGLLAWLWPRMLRAENAPRCRGGSFCWPPWP